MTDHIDPRLPAPEACVQRYLLERNAEAQPDKIFARFADGETWSYARTLEHTIRTAHALQALGVAQDERVLVWLPNCADAIRVWFALNYLGAVFVPMNIAYRGGLLSHAVTLSEARLAIVHAELAPHLQGVETGQLSDVVVLRGDAPDLGGLAVHPATALDSDETAPIALDRPLMPWDLQSIIFTSGTTGPSKGVLSSYFHLHQMADSAPFLDSDDRYMINLPIYHSGGVMPVTAMLIHGGSIAMIESFKTETFWQTVREAQITTTIILGVMGNFLLKQPQSADDRDHSLRSCTYVPLNASAMEFHERFGTDVHTHFNMTEVSMPLVSPPNPTALGSAGRPRPGIEVRIVDENDCELPPGEMGELVVRTDCPWAISHGYAANPQATADAWRNGWFHTGDGFKRDEEGNFYFCDRLKDAIRRRGENISSFEVESEIAGHPAVREAAAVAVRSEEAEDEVLAVIAMRPGETLEPAALIEFLRPRMAHFMIPRFVRFVDELPRTPTAKIKKVELREEGITADTWDREKAGIVVKRDTIST
ncbi:crotonobetaine/carnitine-CoA ligase [Salinihabitans flavidus]|uniref:Crotonobetaine/carnitine-CoA ligase n=1 Tax=Salinihabitans flavidus TaxID=569882 RepID=A0A1H8V814_9RHOB|nr:AMP-binding protein [Salinihabitans flavidus]SEP11384.1 crotonobetaine/carnitine-CoA ligase [Salinihabitans flavidus]